MSYLYVSNVSPRDRYDRITLQMDNGSTVLIRQGHAYDLSASELVRAQRFVVMSLSSSIPAETPTEIARLPIIGTPQDGDIPVWSSANSAFVLGQAASGGGGGNVYSVFENSSTGWSAITRPFGARLVFWIGWDNPGKPPMTDYDVWISVPAVIV